MLDLLLTSISEYWSLEEETENAKQVYFSLALSNAVKHYYEKKLRSIPEEIRIEIDKTGLDCRYKITFWGKSIPIEDERLRVNLVSAAFCVTLRQYADKRIDSLRLSEEKKIYPIEYIPVPKRIVPVIDRDSDLLTLVFYF